MSKWISVKERLPDNEQEVLTYSNYGIVLGEYLNNYDWFPVHCDNETGNPDISNRNITHWMALPEPPKED